MALPNMAKEIVGDETKIPVQLPRVPVENKLEDTHGLKMVQRKARAEKVAKLIVEALHDLREPGGSDLKTIKRYIRIRYGYRKLRDKIIPDALEHGVQCGLIQKIGSCYQLDPYLPQLARKRFQFLKSPKSKKKQQKINICNQQKPSPPSSSTSTYERRTPEGKTKSLADLPSTSRGRRKGIKNETNRMYAGRSSQKEDICSFSTKSAQNMKGLKINTSNYKMHEPSTSGVKRKKIEHNDPSECKRKSMSFSSISSLRRKRTERSKYSGIRRNVEGTSNSSLSSSTSSIYQERISGSRSSSSSSSYCSTLNKNPTGESSNSSRLPPSVTVLNAVKAHLTISSRSGGNDEKSATGSKWLVSSTTSGNNRNPQKTGTSSQRPSRNEDNSSRSLPNTPAGNIEKPGNSIKLSQTVSSSSASVIEKSKINEASTSANQKKNKIINNSKDNSVPSVPSTAVGSNGKPTTESNSIPTSSTPAKSQNNAATLLPCTCHKNSEHPRTENSSVPLIPSTPLGNNKQPETGKSIPTPSSTLAKNNGQPKPENNSVPVPPRNQKPETETLLSTPSNNDDNLETKNNSTFDRTNEKTKPTLKWYQFFHTVLIHNENSENRNSSKKTSSKTAVERKEPETTSSQPSEVPKREAYFASKKCPQPPALEEKPLRTTSLAGTVSTSTEKPEDEKTSLSLPSTAGVNNKKPNGKRNSEDEGESTDRKKIKST